MTYLPKRHLLEQLSKFRLDLPLQLQAFEPEFLIQIKHAQNLVFHSWCRHNFKVFDAFNHVGAISFFPIQTHEDRSVCFERQSLWLNDAGRFAGRFERGIPSRDRLWRHGYR